MTEYHVRAGGGEGFLPTLAAARAKVKSGDTVIVHDGTYKERLQATAPGVVWRAAEGERVVIDGGWNGAKTENGDPGPTLVSVAGAGHSLDVDNYRPDADSPLIGAGLDGATIGALEPLPDGPPPPDDDEPPVPAPVDWPALAALVIEATTRLSAAGRDVAEARQHAAAAASALVLAGERLASAQVEQAAAADALAALLAKMNEESA